MADTPVWMPTRIERYERLVPGTSTQPAIVMTDAGTAYIKCMGNREGPHALARELVGTRLAKWFGLPTLDVAMMHHDGIVSIPVGDGRHAEVGPAFVSRAEEGRPWSGDSSELDVVVNQDVFTRLVVFDTWIRNRDRCSPDGNREPNYENVFLSTVGLEGDRVRLLAIDHTHAFAHEADLSPQVNRISNVQDEDLYGLFPEFKPRLNRTVLQQATDCLGQVNEPVVQEVIDEVPAEWEVPDNVRSEWNHLLVMRARFLVDRIDGLLAPYLPTEKLF